MATGQIYVKSGSTALFWRDNSDIERSRIGVDDGVVWTTGRIAVGSMYFYYQPPTGNLRRISGNLITTSQSPAGRIWYDTANNQIRYIASNGGLYYIAL